MAAIALDSDLFKKNKNKNRNHLKHFDAPVVLHYDPLWFQFMSHENMPLKHQIGPCAKTLAVLEIDVTVHFTMHICSHKALNT